MGLQALTGKEQQFQHAYEVSGRGCRISLVGNIRSNMPTMYQVGATGSHELGTKIVHAYYASGGDFRISRVRNARLNVPIRSQDGVA